MIRGLLAATLALSACASTPPVPAGASTSQQAADFLDVYNSVAKNVSTVAAESAWAASTDVKPETAARRAAAGRAWAAVVGDARVIARAKSLLAHRDELEPLQVRQLETMLRDAATAPGTLPKVVKALVEAESRQSAALDGFRFCLAHAADGSCLQPVTTNEIDRILRESDDPVERRRAWVASKEVGKVLKQGLAELRDLRNQVAREMGYSSYFALQVSDYGMSVEEMMTLLESFVTETKPLYDGLHGWTKDTLATRYALPEPEGAIPADWMPNRWAQHWPGLVPAVDLDPYFEDRSAEWIVQQAERFYVSLGFETLPKSFWEKSDLYALPADAARKKNAHASAWHINLERDVRSLMSVMPSADWFGTAHHELGHIYYYLSYARPEVPPVLRRGANRAFHEAVGDLVYIAASQEPYLRGQGILHEGVTLPQDQLLLNEALEQTVTFIPWSAGVMSRFEYELYEKELPPEQWQSRWWALVEQYQGVKSPDPSRLTNPELCDACTKTHISDDPAQYYDYAIAAVLKHQLHDHIARHILHADPHRCDYFGNKQVGAFLEGILEKGATQDWRKVLRDATGEDLSIRALREYFEPVQATVQ